MNYLAFICPDDTSAPDEEMIFASEAPRWVEEMERRGVRLLGRELEAPSSASTVRVRNNETLVTDGPFVETKEFIAGFDILECCDLDEAIEVVAKHPVAWFHQIEIRPFRDGLELGAPAERFGAGDDAVGNPYCLMPCLDGIPAAPEVEESIMRQSIEWWEDLKARGIGVFGHPLAHKDTATTVRVRNGEMLVTDGPFAETKEFVGGIAVISCDAPKEAIEIAAAHPLAQYHMVEVRPFVRQ